MLPQWFDKWVRDNPQTQNQLLGPAILIGVVGGAVVLATIIVAWGWPWQVSAMQTGPRGTAMGVVKFDADRATPDPTVAGYSSATPLPPQPGDQLARDAHEDAEPLLGDLTVANYDRLIGAMREWTGIPDLLSGEENYQTVVARRMIQMTQNLNENWSGHVNASGEAGVNCYTCHRGEPVPSNVWFRIDPAIESARGWNANQNLATAMTVSTSLPHDALQKYLVEGETIAVHDLEPRVANQPGDPLIQQAERTYSLMNYVANALGVNCTFCHNTNAFYDPAQVTPQWANASLGIQMVLEINNDYLLPLESDLPPERLGPKYADAPKVACKTCHKGYQKPMGGMDMVTDWPELATTGAPVYE